MSLRQRSHQRPSGEPSNEAGYYGGSPQQQQQNNYMNKKSLSTNMADAASPPGSGNEPRRSSLPTRSAPSSGGYSPPSPSRPRTSSSGGYSSSGYSSGGYYGYNNNTAAAAVGRSSSGMSATSSASFHSCSSSGGYAGYHQAATPVNQQPVHQSSAGYPNTAPPSYNQGGYGQAASGAGMPARAINFDGSAGYGGGGGVGTGYGQPQAGYGGYNPTAAPGSLGSSGHTKSNPYQKSKSSGFTFRHFLLSTFVIFFLILTGTTIYYRNIMKEREVQLAEAKAAMEAHKQRTGGRFGGRRNTDHKQNSSSDEHRPIAEEKKYLEKELSRLTTQLSQTKNSHTKLLTQQTQKTQILSDLEQKKQDFLKAIDHTSFLLKDKAEELAKYKAMVDGREEVESYMKKREGALWKRVELLEDRIGRQSQREAEEWFGPGPHKVELLLEYPKVTDPAADPSTWPRIRNTLTIQLVPLDLMPHTVNLFLQQVHHGLWDGCSARWSPSHILQFGPSYKDEDKNSEENTHLDQFRDKGLDRISYQEYSENFTHKQWTVGLAGRPGGPDFYINKEDNTFTHGPGGQAYKNDLHNEADPCFGRISMESGSEDENDNGALNGRTILNQIARIPTNPERGFEIMYPVVIIDAKVMMHKENPQDGLREVPRGTKWDQQDDIMPLPEVPHGV